MLEIKENVPLAKFSTFGLGGPAAFGIVAHTVDELREAVHFAEEKKMPWRVLGGGSNLLVADEGFPGVIIWYHDREIKIEGTRVYAGAGAITAAVAGATVRAGLTGFEWAAGVPGTIGGAVYGNAGASGGEMKDTVVRVTVLEDGALKIYDNAACAFAYRHSRFKNFPAVIISVELQLAFAENNAEPTARMKEVLEYRMNTQPKGVPSSGCTFKNVEIGEVDVARLQAAGVPENFLAARRVPAGWLIESVGLKGLQCGDALISSVHGNFMVPGKAARAVDIAELIERAKAAVQKKFGLTLEEEITRLNI